MEPTGDLRVDEQEQPWHCQCGVTNAFLYWVGGRHMKCMSCGAMYEVVLVNEEENAIPIP